MGVVRDATIEQLTQAVGGIDTSGLVKDSTAQATNTLLGNINTTLGGITTNDPPTDTTQQSIATAITTLGSTLGSDKANIDGSNIANQSAFRSAIGVDAIFIEGVTSTSGLPTFAANSANAVTINVTKSGYTPKGIIEITGSGTTGLVLQEFYILSNNAYVYFRNATSSSITPTRIRVVVFYIKN